MNKKKIDICFFVGSFQIGGAENHVLQILQNIDKTRYRPYLCVFKSEGGLREKFTNLDIPILILSFWRRNFILKYFNLLKYIFYLMKNKIHIVHVHLIGCFYFGVMGAKIAKIDKIIITWHGLYDIERIKKPQYVKFGSKNATHIIAVSQKVKENNCNLYNIKPSKVTIIYNGILPARNIKLITFGSKKFSVGCVGNLRKEKGIKYLLYALSEFKKTIPDIELIIVGDGPLKKELEILAKKLGVKNITRFLGRRSDVEELLMTFDVWVLPSIYEGFSIALLEAMRAGLPIIATNVGGNAEAIEHDVSGIIVQPKDPKMLAKAIQYMFEHKERRKELGRNAKIRYEKYFTIDVMLDDLYKLYEKEYG